MSIPTVARRLELLPSEMMEFFTIANGALNGSIKLEGSFLNEDNFNYRNGTWTFWYKNGVVRKNVDYSYDFKVGSTTVYNQDGSIQKSKSLDPKPMLNHFI